MNEAARTPPAPVSFALTKEEAQIAAARAGLRASLSGRLLSGHVAPLVAFALLIAFVAILAFTGLIGRRFVEAALILAAIAFMAIRMIGHWRMWATKKQSLAAALACHGAGAATAWFDDDALHVETAAGSRRLAFADCGQAEEAGGIVYVWPRAGEPAVIPMRAFADPETAAAFLAFVRAKVGRATPRPG